MLESWNKKPLEMAKNAKKANKINHEVLQSQKNQNQSSIKEENGYSGSSLMKFYTIWNADIPTGIPIDMLTHTTVAS